MLTQGNLLSNARDAGGVLALHRADVLLHALPIFHTHGLFVATNITLLRAGDDLPAEIRPRHGDRPDAGATAMMGVPTFYTRLLERPALTRDLVAHMRLFVSGSAPLLAETHTAFEARTGHRILERYGMTETNMNTSNPYDGDRRAGTVGFPLPGVELKITDPETGAEMPRARSARSRCAAPTCSRATGRCRRRPPPSCARTGSSSPAIWAGSTPTATSHRRAQQGPDHLGRLQHLPQGDRADPRRQPGVLESAVIGVPHADFGETVLGLIVPEPGDAGPGRHRQRRRRVAGAVQAAQEADPDR
jgi:malonyl-CoA/methylmalonyl-CoA synthetase